MALKVPKDHQARKALKDLRDHRDPKDPPVLKEEMEEMEGLVRQGQLAQQELRDLPDPQERLLKHSAVGRLPTQ